MSTVTAKLEHGALRAWPTLVLAAALIAAPGVGARVARSAELDTRREGIGLGVRAVAADFAWIAAHAAWERRDAVAMMAGIRRATTLDPDRLYFWINGARMMAYDVPAWRMEEAGGVDSIPDGVRQRLAGEHAIMALAHLQAALARHPDRAELWIEIGNLRLLGRGDLVGAAEAYGRAARTSQPPAYALRVEIVLLVRAGRLIEARDRLMEVRSGPDAGVREGADSNQAWVEVMLMEIDRSTETVTDKE